MKQYRIFALFLLSSQICFGQSVYMHEAQDDNLGSVSLKNIIYSFIFIFFIYLITTVIKNVFQSNKNQNSLKIINKKCCEHNEVPKQTKPIVPYVYPSLKGTAPIRDLTPNQDKKLHNLHSKITTLPCGVKAIDLGLDVYFSDRNLGAEDVIHRGNKYSWGGLLPVRPSIPWQESELACVSKESLDKRFSIFNNFGSYSGDVKYDAAVAELGKGWRTPTIYELQMLIDKCKWIYLDKDSIRGYKVIGPNKNFIFIPMDFDPLYHMGDIGTSTMLLSSTASDDNCLRKVGSKIKKCAKYISVQQYPREEFPKLEIIDCVRGLGGFIRPVITSIDDIRINTITEEFPRVVK
ncbi:MAG: hypothetical protein J1F06_00575 [Prevotellaceae bacterium]|nr:hypothetical protein [Prevotellaceae bacterium]